MFYKLIEQKRNQWLNSPECTVKALLNHIQHVGKMRDAQLDAIKTYLFLKIACSNKPLWRLFHEGFFTNLSDIAEGLVKRDYETLASLPHAATALFYYAGLKNKNGKQLSPQLSKYILEYGDSIDYAKVFHELFYGVDYADYLFSLPMGAGKTYLMAAFIYLDLYFATLEPNNPVFAHNFMILAPSGLKSSIIPSLKNIKGFDPSWIIPEPAASNLRKLIHFEILDEQKSANKSNRVKNPNAQKLANLQPFEDLMGLVAITNAEKVILDKVTDKAEGAFLSEELDKDTRLANELRAIIGKIPHLGIYIDEVHHAADGEIKLRQVVNEWTKGSTCCGVLGFSGTPYLEKAESVTLGAEFSIKNTDLSNVVYHYPLAQGVGNFLKTPKVLFAEESTETIVRNGVNDFLDSYTNTVYPKVGYAKLAIYCGQIETLEEVIYPLVAAMLAEKGIDPITGILKYHGGNSTYAKPEQAEYEFASLDSELSKVRIILLVQIGKEGWDCRSLTGVILPHAGACPKNMVLQTSCRCLRQVESKTEDALIWLNKVNAETLNKQLLQQQNITLREFNNVNHAEKKTIERFSRMERQKVPPIDFLQLKISYETLVVENAPNTVQRLENPSLTEEKETDMLIEEQNLEGETTNIYSTVRAAETQHPVTFRSWLHHIVKGSFGTLSAADLSPHENRLKEIFNTITEPRGDSRILRAQYKHAVIESKIRQCFIPKRDFTVREEVYPVSPKILQEEHLSTLMVEDDSSFFPSQHEVQEILKNDAKPDTLPEGAEELLAKLRAMGIQQDVNLVKVPSVTDHTYHYLPYRFDSNLETAFFKQLLAVQEIQDKNLEFYFNGDELLTEFKIRCYSKRGNEWHYIGRYVPDFLILSRTADGNVHQVIIVETKGEGYAANFAERKAFMEGDFIKRNNEHYGYNRFDFLYLEDTLSAETRIKNTLTAIQKFFIN